MNLPRSMPQMLVLPDGQVLVTGGQVDGTARLSVRFMLPKCGTPTPGLWTLMASHARPRMYHATSVLLPDGRVLVASGENAHVSRTAKRMQRSIHLPIFSRDLARPYRIHTHDHHIRRAVPHRNTRWSTNRLDCIHAPGFVHSQLRPEPALHPPQLLTGHRRPGSIAPVDGNTAPPGDYMLFLVNTTGVPSVANFIRIAPECSDTHDNDGSGQSDYPADPGCLSIMDPSEGPDCSDGIDNDRDGFLDYPTDPGCSDALDNTETSPALICDDGIDNDGDGVKDFPHDTGCDSSATLPRPTRCSSATMELITTETAPPTTPKTSDVTASADTFETSVILPCDDGIDNDGDGAIDYPADPDCEDSEGESEATDPNADTDERLRYP